MSRHESIRRLTTLGIIGGIAPESTIDYYRRVIAGYRARLNDGSYPCVLINSIDMSKLLSLAGANDLVAMADYLVREVSVLAQAGASVALFASNTPHLVFASVQERSPIPLISIVEATCLLANARGLKRVGLLGTKFTMQGAFYSEVFSKHEIKVILPTLAEQEIVHGRYVGELIEGVFLSETRTELMSVIETMTRRDNLDGVVLAGTELPMLLRVEVVNDVPLLDTTGIHVSAAIDRMLG